jgi:hypothetical protein
MKNEFTSFTSKNNFLKLSPRTNGHGRSSSDSSPILPSMSLEPPLMTADIANTSGVISSEYESEDSISDLPLNRYNHRRASFGSFEELQLSRNLASNEELTIDELALQRRLTEYKAQFEEIVETDKELQGVIDKHLEHIKEFLEKFQLPMTLMDVNLTDSAENNDGAIVVSGTYVQDIELKFRTQISGFEETINEIEQRALEIEDSGKK